MDAIEVRIMGSAIGARSIGTLDWTRQSIPLSIGPIVAGGVLLRLGGVFCAPKEVNCAMARNEASSIVASL